VVIGSWASGPLTQCGEDQSIDVKYTGTGIQRIATRGVGRRDNTVGSEGGERNEEEVCSCHSKGCGCGMGSKESDCIRIDPILNRI
jgi:hypothetical protein